jgi:hypothetical protein
MGTGSATSRSREPDTDPLTIFDDWLRKSIWAIAGVAIAYFTALFVFSIVVR